MLLLFVSGVIASLLAVVAELALASITDAFGFDLTAWDPSRDGFVMTAFLLGITLFAAIEEVAKFSILRIQLPRVPTCRPLPLSFLFGIGFAAVEIALLSAEHADVFAHPLPTFGIGAVHILTAVAYGLLPTDAGRPRRFLILSAAVCSHAFYNIFLALI